MLSHFEKGKEAGVVGGGGVPAREVSQELSPSQDTAGCTVARGGGGGAVDGCQDLPNLQSGLAWGSKASPLLSEQRGEGCRLGSCATLLVYGLSSPETADESC